ncbi:DUF3021 domain-containing protein [Lactiplantibacillus sp. WILCCON 0030]|uniref:DUF3021 domain-containing protein n=1 Tax=Lactiplantibacillus brownii TaxID=3069269 RepID=A0ABU1A743_9LACO|nr:DUF3021 domain-containing protein [Lactiplantibacillus brownii]MDQ7936767.1 DUF3021 domain-containing protein [Lactiplantibacillus brownii]
MLKKIVHNAMSGIGFGSFAYMLIMLFKVQPIMPTTANILSILVMSVGIGMVSLIFQSDALPWLTELGIHFVGTFFLVAAMMGFNHWPIVPSFWVTFVALYVICWIIIRVQRYLQVERINSAIAKRRQKRADE